MARQKKRITEKTLKTAIYGAEPRWEEYAQPSDESRKISLIVSLQYFNSEYDKKKSWSFVKTWLKQNISLFKFLDKNAIDSIGNVFSNHFVSSIYSLMRCQTNGLILNTNELDHIRNHLKLLLSIAEKTGAVSDSQPDDLSNEKKKISPIDRVRMKVESRITPELEGFFDDVLRNRRSSFSSFSLSELIQKDESLSGSVSNVAMLQPIIDWTVKIQELLDELDSNPDDIELQDAYPSFDRRTKNRIKKYVINGLPHQINEYNESLKQKRNEKKKKQDSTSASVQTQKKPQRKKKPVDPSRLVATFRIQQEDQEHSLSSLDPKKIIGASCVILYNTKYKTVHLAQAPDGGALSVKGMAITGFDEATSFSIRLRKPADVLPTLLSKTKLQIIKQLQSLTTKATVTKGRTTDTTLILRIFN